MKKLFMVGVVILSLICVTGLSFAADSASKNVTVNTEIQRGYSAVSAIKVNGNPMTYFSDVSMITEANKQKNTDTDGFYLGVYFRAFIKMYDILKVFGSDYDESTRKTAESNTTLFFNEYRARAKKLGLDDNALSGVVGVKYEVVKPKIDEWASKISQ